MLEPFILLGIGLIAGVIAGMMGVGGGIIFTPVLYFLFDEAGVQDPVVWTIGTGLFCTFIAAFGSTVRQVIQKNMFWKEGIMLGVLGAIGVYAGKLIVTSDYYDRAEFTLFFSVILVYAAVMMFRRGADQEDEYLRKFEPMRFKEGFVTGGIGGLIAALAGVGGGGIMVPIMNLFFKQPFRKTVSVSQLGMTIMVFTGWFQLALMSNVGEGISPYTLGFVDFGTALPLSAGGLLGGFAGAFLNHKVKRKYLQWGFAILAFVMAARLIWTTFIS